jgi:hypothetical protein
MHPKACNLKGNFTPVHKKHENPTRKSYTKKMQHKACIRIRVKQEKEASSITGNTRYFCPFSTYYPSPPHHPFPFSRLTLQCMPLHHLLATNPNAPLFFRISLVFTNHIRCYNSPWKYTQSPAFFNITSLPSLQHIITTSPSHRLNPPITPYALTYLLP